MTVGVSRVEESVPLITVVAVQQLLTSEVRSIEFETEDGLSVPSMI
jgi:hypothetical protein